MPILEVFTTSMMGSALANKGEPEKFLQTALAITAGAKAPEPVVQTPAARVSSGLRLSTKFLDQEICDEEVARLRVRGLRLHPRTHVVGVRSQEGIIILFAQSGALHFTGPLPTLNTFKGLDWSGVAETIEISREGGVQLVNSRGVYGSVAKNASRRVLLTMEDHCEMVLRSVDVNPDSGKVRPLASTYEIRQGEIEQTAEPPVEIRIALDPIYGIRRIERYASPTPLVLGSSVHQNVILAQHNPAVAMTRLECRSPQDGQVNVYCLNGIIS
jgi:hypothetical protein